MKSGGGGGGEFFSSWWQRNSANTLSDVGMLVGDDLEFNIEEIREDELRKRPGNTWVENFDQMLKVTPYSYLARGDGVLKWRQRA